MEGRWEINIYLTSLLSLLFVVMTVALEKDLSNKSNSYVYKMSDLFLPTNPPQSMSATIPDHLEPILPHQPVHLASIARGYSNPNTISDLTSDTEGYSLGEMEKVWSEIATTEMRINLMDSLIHNKVGFNDVEMFNLGLEISMKSKSLKDSDKERDTTVIEAAMKRKRKDEVRYRR